VQAADVPIPVLAGGPGAVRGASRWQRWSRTPGRRPVDAGRNWLKWTTTSSPPWWAVDDAPGRPGPACTPACPANVLYRWQRSHGDVAGSVRPGPRTWSGPRLELPRLARRPDGAARRAWPGTTRIPGCSPCTRSAQDPHRPRMPARGPCLRRPPDSIRVVVGDVGGAFGSKGVPRPRRHSWRPSRRRGLGVPVKAIETRSENLPLAAYQGRGAPCRLRAGRSTADGRFLRAARPAHRRTSAPTCTPPARSRPVLAALLVTGVYGTVAADVEVARGSHQQGAHRAVPGRRAGRKAPIHRRADG